MVQVKELVKDKLKNSEADNGTLTLCDNIFNWYEEGGPDLVRSNVNKKMKELKSQFTKEAKEIKEITPKLRKKRKKRRKGNKK